MDMNHVVEDASNIDSPLYLTLKYMMYHGRDKEFHVMNADISQQIHHMLLNIDYSPS